MNQMAEPSSGSRVTITLGRSGQVVKREKAVVDNGFSDSPNPLLIGSKRSVRDRLGNDVDRRTQLNTKRQRGDTNKLSTNGANGVDDVRLCKDDLRFKLMRKNGLRGAHSDFQRNSMDLRETLSREVRPSTTTVTMRQRMPEPTDSRHVVTERKGVSILGRIPSMRSVDALPQMDPLRNSYSPWTLDRLRQRSPDRVFRTSRNLSPQRNVEEIRKGPSLRGYDDSRSVTYTSRDVLEPGRPLVTAPYMTRPTVAAASLKPVVPPPAPPSSSSGIIHKSSYTGNDNLTVDGLLHSLGLEKYAIHFKAEEVDMAVLKQMGDNDLKDLGIPMGPRKKILLALLPRSRQQLG